MHLAWGHVTGRVLASETRSVAIGVGFLVIGLGFVIDVTTGRDLPLSIVYLGGGDHHLDSAVIG